MSYSADQCSEIVRVTGARKTSSGWQGHCVAHDDADPSFSITQSDDQTIVNCFAGCDFSDIEKALEAKNIVALEKTDFKNTNKFKETRYPWRDLAGQLAFEKIRKDYSDGSKKIYCMPGGFKGQLQPYKYELWQDCKNEIIYIVEGEKCAEHLLSLALKATTTGGCESWRSYHASFFAGREVVVWPDKDKPGRKYADKIFRDLNDIADVKIIEPPDELMASQDVIDWFALGHTKDEFLKLVDSVPWAPKKSNFTFDKDSLNSLENLVAAIPILKITIWFDKFYQKIFYSWKGSDISEWNENVNLELTISLQKELNFKRCTKDTVRDAVQAIAHRNIKDDPLDWIDSLEWDGIERLDQFAVTCLGCESTEYNQKALSNYFIQIVARIFKPGCQADHFLILEGGQGIGKTSALRAIGGKYYAEITDNPGSKDFAITLRGVLIGEISELSSLSKADLNETKSAITRTVDHYRPPYGRDVQDFPRRCVLAGTTNESEYLKDTTGARRFWPIKVGIINLEKIKEDRDQLFAEAAFRYKRGDTYWEMPEEAKKQQEARRPEDTWEAIIQNHLEKSPIADTSISEILKECFEIEGSKHDPRNMMRAAKCLKLLGWESYLSPKHRFKRWRKSK